MKLYYNLGEERYGRLLFGELLRRRLINPIFLLLYLVGWQTLYSLSKFGRLRKNLPILAVLGVVFMGILIQLLADYAIRRLRRPLWRGQGIGFAKDSLVIAEADGSLAGEILWTQVECIRDNRNWYYLFCTDKRFLPLPKALFTDPAVAVELEIHRGEIKRKKIRGTWAAAAVWLCVTAAGLFAVGKSALNYNGKLSWYISRIQNTRTVSLENDNLFETGLDGIMETAAKKVDFMPFMMQKSLSVHLKADGTVKTFDAYIYGYDVNYKLVKTYLLWYDAGKGRGLSIEVRDYEGVSATEDSAFKPNRDFRYVEEIFRSVGLKDIIEEDGAEGYGFSYKVSGIEPCMRLYVEATDKILEDFYLTEYPFEP